MSRLDVLFVGNSHTYLHHLPRLVKRLAASRGRASLEVDQSTGRGVSLQWHWENPRTRRKIEGRAWDCVVLQDRSGGPLQARDAFERYAALLHAEIAARGAATLLYMTWAARGRPEDQALLAEAYLSLGQRLGAGVVPVGLAWAESLRLRPDLDLFHRDGRHAGPAGAYLGACVFFERLCGRNCEKLPSTLWAAGKCRVDLDAHTAGFLQRIAHRTVEGMKR